jgi:hypothetical protein
MEIIETIKLLKQRSQRIVDEFYEKYNLSMDDFNELHLAKKNISMYEMISKKYE